MGKSSVLASTEEDWLRIKAAVLDRGHRRGFATLNLGLSSGRGPKKCFMTEAAA